MYNYKTTYFKISLNEEISISSSDYKKRTNAAELQKSIIETIEIINRAYPDAKLEFESMSILELKELKYKHLYSKNDGFISQLINLFTSFQNINNRRFSSEHEEELNLHLNENAKDDWKLISMNPIIKGFGNKENNGSFGHDVTEGFVLVWEKKV